MGLQVRDDLVGFAPPAKPDLLLFHHRFYGSAESEHTAHLAFLPSCALSGFGLKIDLLFNEKSPIAGPTRRETAWLSMNIPI
jgi:hypothetical protein